MYCSKCGREVSDDANFCKYCGHDFSKDKIEGNSIDESHDTLSDAHDNVAPSLDAVDTASTGETATIVDASNSDSNVIPPANSENDAENTTKGDIIGRKVSRRQRIKKQREIEDARSLDAFTVKDEMVSDAPILDKSRISLKDRGTLAALKTKEIIYIVIAALLMIVPAILIAVIRTNNEVDEDNMSALVVVGYFLFFVVFAGLALGVDRVYNLLTLSELSVRKVTLKKYGWRMQPLALKDGRVFGIEIEGACDMCSGENRGTYHIEWHGDDLIAVCNYNRKHLYRIDIRDITDEGESAVQDNEDK